MRFLLAVLLLPGTSLALLRADDGMAKERAGGRHGFSSTPRCTQEECEQIHRGMTVQQAASILRWPPGDYTGGKGMFICFIDPFPADAFPLHYRKYWCGYHGAIGLELDSEGKVDRADWYPALYPGHVH
jgi:hypothetical protein